MLTQMDNFRLEIPPQSLCARIGNITYYALMCGKNNFTLTVTLVCFQLTLGGAPRAQLDKLPMRKTQGGLTGGLTGTQEFQYFHFTSQLEGNNLKLPRFICIKIQIHK